MSNPRLLGMTRAEKHARVVALQRSGLTVREVALKLGMSDGGVATLINDPDGSKQRARRERYRGKCEDCGKPTDGSNGKDKAPRWCRACIGDHVRIWTREAVIDAIQLWASGHDGHPPTASQWMRASECGRFPAATTVYRSTVNKSAVFYYWADAIEAAGFPRPLVGIYGQRESWNKERIIEAIQQWTTEHGRTPMSLDWRYAQRGRPVFNTVVRHFGSWANGVEAAGFPRPRRRGGRKAA